MLPIVLLVAGLGLAGVGGTALAGELTRRATAAEVAAAAQTEVASRWQRLTAGQIFPAQISYTTADGLSTQARRVGIAPAASCAAALDRPVAELLSRQGCRAVLRATYTDASGTLVATLGVAVMPSVAAQQRVQFGSGPAGGWGHAGVRAAAFPGTAASSFTDRARAMFIGQFRGPYIFLVTGGYVDGRRGKRAPGPVMDLVTNLAQPAVAALTDIGNPCARKDITC